MSKKWNEAYLLLESLLALGLMLIGVFVYQTSTLYLLQQDQIHWQKARATRILQEEMQEYLASGEDRVRQLSYSQEDYQVFLDEEGTYGKVVFSKGSVEISLEKTSFYFD